MTPVDVTARPCSPSLPRSVPRRTATSAAELVGKRLRWYLDSGRTVCDDGLIIGTYWPGCVVVQWDNGHPPTPIDPRDEWNEIIERRSEPE